MLSFHLSSCEEGNRDQVGDAETEAGEGDDCAEGNGGAEIEEGEEAEDDGY